MKQKQNNNTHTTKPQKQHKQQHPQKAPRPAGKTDYPDSIWCHKSNPSMERCLWHAQWGDFWFLSPTRRPKSLRSTADANASLSYPFQHCSLAPTVLMHLVRAAYIRKRKLPYPSACCVHCPNTVSGTRGTREQHQVAVLRDRVLLPSVVVGHLLTSYQTDACCTECQAV